MSDIRNRKLIYLKAILFLAIGLGSGSLLLAEVPSLKAGLLLGLCVWAFCRAYYFAFHVVEHYLDPGYKFSGLISFARYILRRNRDRRGG